MDITADQFIEAFNARAEEIGHGLRISGVALRGDAQALEMEKDGQPAPQLGMITSGVRMSWEGGPVVVQTVQLIVTMAAASACDGLSAYATVIDVLHGGSDEHAVKWRNDLLRRLGFFDGRLATGRPMRTEAQGTVLEVQANMPARGLMRMTVKLPRG